MGRETQAVGSLEPVVAVAGLGLRLCRRRRDRHRHRLSLGIPGLGRRTGHRLVHSAVAGGAAVETGHIAEVVVERELGQPDLIHLQRAIERVQHRQLQHALPRSRPPLLERLLELGELGAMVGHGLGRIILALGHLPQQGVEFLAMGVGILERQARSSHVLPLGVGEREQRCLTVCRRVFGHGELVVGAILVKFGPPQLQRAGEVVFAKLRSLDDVAKPGQEVTADHKPLIWVLLRAKLVDVELGPIRRLGILRDSSHLGDERLGDSAVEIGPPRLAECRLEFGPAGLVGRGVLLVDPRLGGPRLKLTELPGVLLPGPVVVGRQHEHRRQQERHGGQREHHVQEFEVPPGLFCCRHRWVMTSFGGGRLGYLSPRSAQPTGFKSSVRTRGC